jgi:hypothetical protein
MVLSLKQRDKFTFTYSKVCTSKHLSCAFPTQNGLKEEDSLSPLLFNFALEYSIMKAQENQEGLELKETHQPLAYVDNVHVLGEIINTIKKNKEALQQASREGGLEVSICLYLITRMQNKITI